MAAILTQKALRDAYRHRYDAGVRMPRLAALAAFLNAHYSAFVRATVASSYSNTDRKISGTRLISPGRGRNGTELTVVAVKPLSLRGFRFGNSKDRFKKGERIFDHDSSETYRMNYEAVGKTVDLIDQLDALR